jgi:hypothetical protein
VCHANAATGSQAEPKARKPAEQELSMIAAMSGPYAALFKPYGKIKIVKGKPWRMAHVAGEIPIEHMRQ